MSHMTQICPMPNMSHPFISRTGPNMSHAKYAPPIYVPYQICPTHLCPISWSVILPKYVLAHLCPETKYVRPIYVPYHPEPYRPIMSGPFMSHTILNHMDQLCPAHLCPMPSRTIWTSYVPSHLCPIPNMSWPFMSHIIIIRYFAQIYPGPFMSLNQIRMSAQFMSMLETIYFWWW